MVVVVVGQAALEHLAEQAVWGEQELIGTPHMVLEVEVVVVEAD